MEEIKLEITLLLIFLTKDEEQRGKCKKGITKSWKGYLHEILDELEERKLINVNYTEGYIYFTNKGKRKAINLEIKYIKGENREK